MDSGYLEMTADNTSKKNLVECILEKMNKKYLFGWNYTAGTSYYREVVYWIAEIAAGIALLTLIGMDKMEYEWIALIYFIKHLLLVPDYLYLAYRREILAVELLTNLNNIQFWVVLI